MAQLNLLVTCVAPEFANQFESMSAHETIHRVLATKLVSHLRSKNLLLILDDVSQVNHAVYAMVRAICTAVQKLPTTSMKILTSTRDRSVARVPIHDVTVDVDPNEEDIETAERIVCYHANADRSSLPAESRQALREIITICCGLPLALTVAGTSIAQIGVALQYANRHMAWSHYKSRLQNSAGTLGHSNVDGHIGLYASLKSSLELLECEWINENISLHAMFRSLSVLQKKMVMPLSGLQMLWGLDSTYAALGLGKLCENNIGTLHIDVRNRMEGLKLHDLVHDYSVELAKKEESVSVWHRRLVDGFCGWNWSNSSGANTNRSDKLWKTFANNEYAVETIVWHMLGAGRGGEVLKLLTDYEWIQMVNRNEQRHAFEKIMSDFEQLIGYLKTRGENAAGLIPDIKILVKTMRKCLIPFCLENRKECSFQLYGRLASLVSQSSVIQRMLWGIERYSSRPWVRPRAGVLGSVNSTLERLLKTDILVVRMALLPEREELIIGGKEGALRVISCHDGEERYVMQGHTTEISGICVDKESAEIYSCSADGVLIVWKDGEQVRSFEINRLEESDHVCSTLFLQTQRILLIGCQSGKLRFLDVATGTVSEYADGHSDAILSLAVTADEKMVVSGSADHSIRMWNTSSRETIGDALTGHTDKINTLALSPDDKLVVSASNDKSIRLWDVQERRQFGGTLPGSENTPNSVTFNTDGTLMCSAGTHQIVLWGLENVQNRTVTARCYSDIRMSSVTQLAFSSDGSEVFASSPVSGSIAVWRTDAPGESHIGRQSTTGSYFEGDVAFATSDDGEVIVTVPAGKRIELRRISDTDNFIADHVLSTFSIPSSEDNNSNPDIAVRVAVSNDHRMVAYAKFLDCNVWVVDLSSGDILHTFTDLEDWATTVRGRNDICVAPRIKKIRFSDDGRSVYAEAAPTVLYGFEPICKSRTWSIVGGYATPSELNPEDPVTERPQYTGGNGTKSPRLVGMRTQSTVYTSQIFLDTGDDVSAIATLDYYPYEVSYTPSTRRFWSSQHTGGIDYIELITEDTELPQRDKPKLPLLPNEDHEDQEDSYDVFISHAGPDKGPIAQHIYSELKALGFTVFFDREELRPGQNAPRRMVHAMRTAKIAIVILSPEFAVRKWTMKELMCFLERGEDEVVIIPVFYRLTLTDCWNSEQLFNHRDDNGERIIDREGFLERLAREGGSIRDVMNALGEMRGITGIENTNEASNRDGEGEEEKRMAFVARVVAAAVEVWERLGGGRCNVPGRTEPRV